MSLKAVVRKGDPTTGGGVVLGGEQTFTSLGTPVATIGDVATCTVPGHPGTVRIVEGSERHRCQGKGMAYDGCMLSCGCRVLATSHTFRIEIEDAPQALDGPGGFAPTLERTSNHGSSSRQTKHEVKAALSAEDGRRGVHGKTMLAPKQGEGVNRGWEAREEAIKHGAQFIRKTYSKGEFHLDDYEYGFDVVSSKGMDGKTVYKWGVIYRGPKKDGDRASTGRFDQDFHTHTRQSPQARDDVKTRWAGLKSSRDYLLPTWPGDMESVGVGSGCIYIGNSDSFSRGVIWKFTLQNVNGVVCQVSDEIKL